MKLLHVITGLGAGGAERALYNLLAGGLAQRHACEVVSLSDAGIYGPRLEALGVRVHALGMRRGLPGPGSILRLRKIVRAFRPDLIQGWMYHANLGAWLACRMVPGRPVLAWSIRQSLYGLKGEKPMTRQVIRANRMLSAAPAALLYNSRLSCEQHEKFGFHAERARVIPNGFDLETWWPAADAERAQLREGLGLPPQAVVFGHMARFHPMKDHARFLRAAVELACTNQELHVVMAGTNVTHDNPALWKWVPEDLADRFHFLGERDDMPALMRMLDVFCLSSVSEAFPNVLGEAMASGVPCVVTNVGDTAHIIGDTGMVVTSAGDEALYDGLRSMLDVDVGTRKKLGREARSRIESLFSLSVVVNQYAALYKSLTDEDTN